jgi:hypothetical protein
VLLHGAYEDGSSWSGVTGRLQRDGYNVVAPAVPLRGIASDTSYLSGVLATIPGAKVLDVVGIPTPLQGVATVILSRRVRRQPAATCCRPDR